MRHDTGSQRRKVLLVELNEITWRWVNPLLKRSKLPTFAEFVREGTSGTPVATEVPPDLDPWISWTSLYTGRPQAEHGVTFLEQPPETVTGPRIWELAADAGRSLGIFGSIMSWPPRRDVKGFWVPGTFSAGPDTFPDELRPIQDLNLSQTRAHTPLARTERRAGKLKLAMRLFKLGLRLSTVARVVSFLGRSRLRPHRHWEKVSLQPVINLDFFESLYRRYQPDFATFHTNHVAHYQHRYWRSADPEPFLVKPSDEEVRAFGQSIEFGYRIADEVLKRAWALADENTVVIVASGLGAQPFVVQDFAEGRAIVRIRDIERIVDICGASGKCTPVSVMAPQWNLQFNDPVVRQRVERVLSSAWCGTPGRTLFSFQTVGNTVCLNAAGVNAKSIDPTSKCVFPDADGQQFAFEELCAVSDATPKQGYHERAGVLLLRGPGIRPGTQIGESSNLDIAPTILHLLGIPIPDHMRGRVLTEAFISSTPEARPIRTNDQHAMVTNS